MQGGAGAAISVVTNGVKAAVSCRKCKFVNNRADYGAVAYAWPIEDSATARTTIDLTGSTFAGARAGSVGHLGLACGSGGVHA